MTVKQIMNICGGLKSMMKDRINKAELDIATEAYIREHAQRDMTGDDKGICADINRVLLHYLEKGGQPNREAVDLAQYVNATSCTLRMRWMHLYFLKILAPNLLHSTSRQGSHTLGRMSHDRPVIISRETTMSMLLCAGWSTRFEMSLQQGWDDISAVLKILPHLLTREMPTGVNLLWIDWTHISS